VFYPGLDAAAEDDELKAEQGWETLQQLAEACISKGEARPGLAADTAVFSWLAMPMAELASTAYISYIAERVDTNGHGHQGPSR
jgi:hypothetical protein